jgi:hypothetical protein
MKAHGAVLHALLRRNPLLTLLGLAMAAVPIAFQGVGWFEPNVNGATYALGMAPFTSIFTALLLGLGAAGLMTEHALCAVPAYRQRILWLSVAVGMLVWLSVVLCLAFGRLNPVVAPWLRWVPLWVYGGLGAGFIGSYLMFRGARSRHPVWAVLGFQLAMWSIIISSTHDAARAWLNMPLLKSLPGFSPMAVLCLFVGPLSWPFLLSRGTARSQAALTRPVTNWRIDAQRRGTRFGGWCLTGVIDRWHGRGHVYAEFQLFSPYLLTMWGGAWVTAVLPFLILLGLLLWSVPINASGILSAGGLQAGLMIFILAFMPLTVPAVQTQRVGQSLLQPGKLSRATLPRWLFGRLLSLWLFGVGVVALPAIGWSLWLGITAQKLGLSLALLVWSVCLAASFVFWRIPGRTRSRALDPAGMLLYGLLLVLFILFDVVLNAFPVENLLAGLALAWLAPALLYRLGLRRWQRMEYGA